MLDDHAREGIPSRATQRLGLEHEELLLDSRSEPEAGASYDDGGGDRDDLTLSRKPQNRVIRGEVRSAFIARTPAVHVAHQLALAPCLSMLPLPILESVSQGSGQRHTPVALDVFPIADSVHREEKALIDGHVRVPSKLKQTTYTSSELPPTQSSFIKMH